MTNLRFNILILFSILTFKVLSQDSEKFDLNFSLSQTQIMLGNTDSAKTLLLSCIELNPKSSASNYSLAYIYYNESDYFNAMTYAEKAVEIKQDNLWYLRLLNDLYIKTNSYD